MGFPAAGAFSRPLFRVAVSSSWGIGSGAAVPGEG